MTPKERTPQIAHVLFMDVVAYSQLPTDHQAQVRLRLQQIVRSLPDFHQALVSRSLILRDTGDGMALAFFGDLTAPINWARRIAGELRSEPRLPMRMGIHTGPVYVDTDLTGAHNLAGDGINIAQRVMDCGDAGHILVSRETAYGLGQISSWKPALHDLGEVEAKHGVRVHIFNVCGEDFGNAAVPSKVERARQGNAGEPDRDRAGSPQFRRYKVFISSTIEDLKGACRDAARDAAIQAGLTPVMSEYFAAAGNPPLAECLKRVDQCDVLVAIAAHRYGWAPPGQPNGANKSITWLECERAAEQGKAVLAFLVNPDADWPPELKEEYRATLLIQQDWTPELMAAVRRDVESLKAFKEWLSQRTRRTFKDAKDIRSEVLAALHEWLASQPGSEKRALAADPTVYLDWLREYNGTIDIRGFGVGSGKVHNFPIEELYIALTTAEPADGEATQDRQLGERQPRERKPVDLRKALEHRRLVVVGDPGSGKSTFLRRITYQMAGEALNGGVAGGPHPPLAPVRSHQNGGVVDKAPHVWTKPIMSGQSQSCLDKANHVRAKPS